MSENKPVELVTCTIDGQQVSVPKGTLIIRAAESCLLYTSDAADE